jgi:hypothetical protein
MVTVMPRHNPGVSGSRVTHEYFDERMVNRQRLLWTMATRRQLERWEPYVAAAVLRRTEGRELDSADIWSAEIEHHFALVAGRHLLRALEFEPATRVSIDPTLRAELIQGRDLHEHWPDNLPVFNISPRVDEPPRPSGRDFAARNPDRGPYWWLGWSNKTGAQLLPHVSAPALHHVLDEVEAEVLANDAELTRFVPPRAPSPWLQQDGEWWPDSTHDLGGRRPGAA